MKRFHKGFTLTEVLVAIFLVGISTAIVCVELVASYGVLRYTTGKLDAQSIAFDELWEVFHLDYDDLTSYGSQNRGTPETSAYGTNGTISVAVLPDITSDFCDIWVRVWPSQRLAIGTNAVAEFWVRRYEGEKNR